MLAASLMILLVILLLMGIPIGFVLLFVGSLGMVILQGFDTLTSYMQTAVYSSVNKFSLTTLPLFILMAHFVAQSRIANDLFNAIFKWVGHFPGGAGLASVFASAGLGTVSGSSIAANSVMSKIAIPEMVRGKYSESFAAGLISACTGTIAVLIPPSLILVVYAIQTENQIGKMLVAGILPGLLLTSMLAVFVVIVAIKNKSRLDKATWNERFKSLVSVWPVALLVAFIVSLIFFGVTTTTEAAAFGAAGALFIGLGMRRLNVKLIIEALQYTVRTTSMIFLIIIGAHIFSYFIALTRVGNKIITAVTESGLPGWSIIIMIVIMYLILGMFLDLIGCMLITLPLVYPLVIGLGYDPIWFGVVLVLILEIGLATPPVGINLFVTSENSGIPVNKVIVGALPFIALMLLCTIILIIFPQIVLYLPSLM